jgi:elongator complex protein 3
VRTQSGVAPLTVLTRPHPCPGKCIFCPNDVRMPKSYLAREPGAQRAAHHAFDPYGQTLGRLLAFHHTGHQVDKVELIILGGTWSFYPEPYQIWFVKRCFDALNDFAPEPTPAPPDAAPGRVEFGALAAEVDGRTMATTYNQIVTRFLHEQQGGKLLASAEHATWDELRAVQQHNEHSKARCVGLVLETRPDHLDEAEALRLRRLGATKVQIGYQSLSDRVLALNQRGHDVAATRRAMNILRQAGFKIHAHWMPNLYGSDPEHDIADFATLFKDPDFRPDELKIYPCSLLPSAELMRFYEQGQWRPYSAAELTHVLAECLLQVPPYCRVTRVVRDIPGDDILVGNKVTNLREVVERDLARRGLALQDIRAREIRSRRVALADLRLVSSEYASAIGREVFLQFVTAQQHVVGFCRLSLPQAPVFAAEIATSAMIREVHVYGVVVGFGELPQVPERPRSQHAGLGRQLVEAAAQRAAQAGFRRLAVISAVGTRAYYRGLGFVDGELYQHRQL